jgi:hypothetical protein
MGESQKGTSPFLSGVEKDSRYLYSASKLSHARYAAPDEIILKITDIGGLKMIFLGPK